MAGVEQHSFRGYCTRRVCPRRHTRPEEKQRPSLATHLTGGSCQHIIARVFGPATVVVEQHSFRGYCTPPGLPLATPRPSPDHAPWSDPHRKGVKRAMGGRKLAQHTTLGLAGIGTFLASATTYAPTAHRCDKLARAHNTASVNHPREKKLGFRGRRQLRSSCSWMCMRLGRSHHTPTPPSQC